MSENSSQQLIVGCLAVITTVAVLIAVYNPFDSTISRLAKKVSTLESDDMKKRKLGASKKSLKNMFSGRILENFAISEIHMHDINSLRKSFPSKGYPNKMADSYNKIIGEEDFVIGDIVRKANSNNKSDAFMRAGPRDALHFNPSEVKAAIVTCGGLCPGLNSVIRELVHALHHLYDAKSVIGIRGGFSGFSELAGYEPIDLTLEAVSDIHHSGGTILASSRGGFDIEIIINFLVKHEISHLYVIGGDGTHRGAYAISEEVVKREINIAVVGIPKTIDNDVDLIDRSFGFTTSVEAAQAAIMSAKTEARCNLPNGIGIVKLMGRSSGFIAVHATLASGRLLSKNPCSFNLNLIQKHILKRILDPILNPILNAI
jgi:hypothetical protein